MFNHAHRVGRRACLHSNQFWRSNTNPYVVQTICDIKKGGCGAIISWVRKSETQEKKKTGPTKSLKARIEDQESGNAEEVSSKTNHDQCIRCGHPYQKITTTWGQTVLCCSQWFATPESKNCKMMKALPGELLPEGKIRWTPPSQHVATPVVSTAAANARSVLMGPAVSAGTNGASSLAAPTISTLPQSRLSVSLSGIQVDQGGHSLNGYGRFANPVRPAGRGLHRTLPQYVCMGHLRPPAMMPSVPAAPAEQTAQQEEVLTLRAMVASLQDQVNQQHARFPAYETPTPCTTDGWTFATDPSNPENDANMEPRT